MQIPSLLPLRRLNDSLPEGKKWFVGYTEDKWQQMGVKFFNVRRFPLNFASMQNILVWTLFEVLVAHAGPQHRSGRVRFPRAIRRTDSAEEVPRRAGEEWGEIIWIAKTIVAIQTARLCLGYVKNSRMMNSYEKHTVEQVRQVREVQD